MKNQNRASRVSIKKSKIVQVEKASAPVRNSTDDPKDILRVIADYVRVNQPCPFPKLADYLVAEYPAGETEVAVCIARLYHSGVIDFLDTGEIVAARGLREDLGFDVQKNGESVEVLTRLHFSADEYRRFREAYTSATSHPGANRDMLLAAYIKRSIVQAANRELYPGYPLTEIENSVSQAIAFMKTSVMKVCELLGESDGERILGLGYYHLSESSCKRLQTAFDNVHSYACGKES